MKYIFTLSILIFINISKADDQTQPCYPELNPVQDLKQIREFVNLYDHVGSRTFEVTKSTCKTSFTTEELEKKITDRAKKDRWWKTSKSSHGIDFEDEDSSLIDLFDQLTTTKEGWITTNYTFKSKCKKVLCAVKEIFGYDVGPRILYILQEYGLNGSHLSFNNTDNWRTKELDLLLQGLEDIPKGMLPLEENKSFVRHQRGYTYTKYLKDEGCVGANSELRFFDCWWESDNGTNRMAVLMHEVGHYIGEELEIDDVSEWLDLSEWKTELYYDSNRKLRSRWTISDNACFLSTYGSTNPAEDFAEMFTAYRYTADKLKSSCPKKYRFMKELVFNGIEFTSDKQFCKKKPELNYENGILRFFRRKLSF